MTNRGPKPDLDEYFLISLYFRATVPFNNRKEDEETMFNKIPSSPIEDDTADRSSQTGFSQATELKFFSSNREQRQRKNERTSKIDRNCDV